MMNTLLFPRAGITRADLEHARGMNQRQAAKRIGISERHFSQVVKDEGLQDMFPHIHNRSRKVTREEIAELAGQGFIRRDVAYMLGISPTYLKDLIAKWNLADEFTVSKGRAAWVARNGYA